MPLSLSIPDRADHDLRAIARTDPPSVFAPGLAIMVLVSIGVVAALMRIAHLAISPSAADDRPYYACAAAAFALYFPLRESTSRIGRAVADCTQWSALFTTIALLGAIASYPVASGSRGFSDATLQHIDHLLRFDWIAWYEVIAAHPFLQVAGRTAYESIYLSPAVLLGFFAWEARRSEAHRFLVSFWLAATVTLVLFRFMPAVGPLASLWRGPVPYLPESALWQPTLIPELRGHLLRLVDVGALRGIVSAPSFHTEAAILYIAAAWPHRLLRVPLTLVNLAMLLATPVEGTHYLTDMLIGALVAGLTLIVVHAIERSVTRRGALLGR